jgi:hypothetical protein
VDGNSFSLRHKHKLSKRLREIRESYVKRLPYIYLIVLLVLSFLSFLSLYFIFMLGVFVIIYFIFILFHFGSIKESSRKLAYAEKLIRLERWRLFLFVFIISSYIIFMVTVGCLSYIGFTITQLPAPFNQIVSFFSTWLIFFIMVSLPLNLRGFQTPYRIAKLCFRVSIDELEIILKQRKLPIKDAYRRFKWLRLGFQSCNNLLIDEPYYVMVKDIDKYYQRIFSFALIGDEKKLKKFSAALQKVLASFGDNRDNFDLPSLLISLQLILDKDKSGKESTQELVKMILVKSSLWDRTKALIRSPFTVSLISISTLIVAILTIAFQFFHWGI